MTIFCKTQKLVYKTSKHVRPMEILRVYRTCVIIGVKSPSHFQSGISGPGTRSTYTTESVAKGITVCPFRRRWVSAVVDEHIPSSGVVNACTSFIGVLGGKSNNRVLIIHVSANESVS